MSNCRWFHAIGRRICLLFCDKDIKRLEMMHERLTFFYRIKAIIARNERLTKHFPRFCTLYQPINNEILGHKGYRFRKHRKKRKRRKL